MAFKGGFTAGWRLAKKGGAKGHTRRVRGYIRAQGTGICQGRRTARGDSREALQTIWQMLQMKGA